MPMMKRPISITIIGWWLIVTGLLGALDSALMEMNPGAVQLASAAMIPVDVQASFGAVNGFVIAACGMGLLKGLWWSRLAYLGWSLIGLVFGFFISPILFIVALVAFYGITLSILCRRSANLWFEHSAY